MSSIVDEMKNAYLAAITRAGRYEVRKWENLDYVYVFKGSRYVKIGYSQSPEGRMRTFQEYVPFQLEMVHFLPGTPKVEKAVQAVLGRYRVRNGDWFHNNAYVGYGIQGLKAVTISEARDAFREGAALRRIDNKADLVQIPDRP